MPRARALGYVCLLLPAWACFLDLKKSVVRGFRAGTVPRRATPKTGPKTPGAARPPALRGGPRSAGGRAPPVGQARTRACGAGKILSASHRTPVLVSESAMAPWRRAFTSCQRYALLATVSCRWPFCYCSLLLLNKRNKQAPAPLLQFLLSLRLLPPHPTSNLSRLRCLRLKGTSGPGPAICGDLLAPHHKTYSPCSVALLHSPLRIFNLCARSSTA